MAPRDQDARDRLLTAATELFSRNGFRSTAVDAIAAEAGVSRSLVFWHFDSKESLLWEVVNASLRRWIDEARAEAAGLRGMAALRQHMERRRAVIRREHAGIRLLYLLIGEAIGSEDNEQALAKFRELYHDGRDMIGTWISQAIEDGEIEATDTDAITCLVFAALTGIDALRFSEGPQFDVDAADRGLLLLLTDASERLDSPRKSRSPARKKVVHAEQQSL